MGYKETKEIKDILLDAKENERLFRVNSGMGWTGKMIYKTKNTITLLNPRPFHGMPEGTPDMIGWESQIITPDRIGGIIAVFKAIEIKTGKTKTTPEQNNFLNTLNKMGGIGEIRRV